MNQCAPRRLEVYISPDCAGSATARRLAREAATVHPHVAVSVIDITALEADATVPVDVVAVPTYVVDGRVFALGNPAPERLFSHLSADSVQSNT